MIDQINKVGGVRTTQQVRRTSPVKNGDASAFAHHMGETAVTEDVGASGATANINAVASVFGAQEVDDALARAARGKIRAEDMLALLDEIRVELLGGMISIGRLQALAHVVSQRRPDIADPRLGAILDEIDLRAQVELAKYQQAAAQ